MDTYQQTGEDFILTGDYSEAWDCLDKITKQKSGHGAMGWVYKAVVQLCRTQYRASIRCCNGALSQDSNLIIALCLKGISILGLLYITGTILKDQEKLQKDIDECRKTVENLNGAYDPYYMLMRAYSMAWNDYPDKEVIKYGNNAIMQGAISKNYNNPVTGVIIQIFLVPLFEKLQESSERKVRLESCWKHISRLSPNHHIAKQKLTQFSFVDEPTELPNLKPSPDPKGMTDISTVATSQDPSQKQSSPKQNDSNSNNTPQHEQTKQLTPDKTVKPNVIDTTISAQNVSNAAITRVSIFTVNVLVDNKTKLSLTVSSGW